MPTTDSTGNNYPVAGGPALPTYQINSSSTTTAGSTTSPTTSNTLIAGVDDTNTVRTVKTDDTGNLSIARLDSVNDAVGVERIRGSDALFINQVAINTTATLIVPQQITTRGIMINNIGTETVYVRHANDVSPTNSLPIAPGDSWAVKTTAPIYGLTQTNPGNVAVVITSDNV